MRPGILYSVASLRADPTTITDWLARAFPVRGGPMRWLLTTVCLLVSLTPVLADDQLPARPIEVPFATVPEHGPWSFDLIDFRADQRLNRAPQPVDAPPHSFFVIKHHLGVAGGYENGIAHASAGYYITVAAWGRWNCGVPAF